MAPREPPPYTKEDIANMKTEEEKIRAFAVLSSYVARMNKEKEELARESRSSFHPHTGALHARPYNGREQSSAGPHRGGFNRGRGGNYGYHPYQRPAASHPAQRFRNNSVAFNHQSSSDEMAEDTSNRTLAPRTQQQIGPKTLCPTFTSTGVCSRRGCQHRHEPDKQALCKSWLYTGNCAMGDSCPLSHDASPHNTPTCHHFQASRCNNDNCRYAHIRINPAAPTCEAFGIMGYCEKGAECSELHRRECPQFANTGTCPNGDSCRLSHTRRASRMRQAARLSSSGPSSPEASSKEDVDDSADSETLVGGTPQDPHQFSGQADFVSLNPDD